MPHVIVASIEADQSSSDEKNSSTAPCYAPYPADRTTRSQAPSPMPRPGRRLRRRHSTIEPASSPTPSNTNDIYDSDVEVLDIHVPVTLVPPHEASALQDAVNSAITASMAWEDFAVHVTDVATGDGGNADLFPNNDVLREVSPGIDTILESLYPSNPLLTHDGKTHLHRDQTYLPIVNPPNPEGDHAWAAQVADALNHQSRTIEQLKKLLIHSICQSNVLGMFSGTATHEVELHLHTMEAKLETIMATSRLCQVSNDVNAKPEIIDHRLSHLNAAAQTAQDMRHASPSDPASAQDDLIHQITRKVTAIEQKVTRQSGGNPPGQAILPFPQATSTKGKRKEQVAAPSRPAPPPPDNNLSRPVLTQPGWSLHGTTFSSGPPPPKGLLCGPPWFP